MNKFNELYESIMSEGTPLTKKIGNRVYTLSSEVDKLIKGSKSKVLSILSKDKRAKGVNLTSIKIETSFTNPKKFWALGMNAEELSKYVKDESDKKYLLDLATKLDKAYG